MYYLIENTLRECQAGEWLGAKKQFVAILFNNCRKLFRHLRWILHKVQPLFKLTHSLNAPDWKNVILAHKGHAGFSVCKQAAGQAFHGNKANVIFPALFYKCNVSVSCKV